MASSPVSMKLGLALLVMGAVLSLSTPAAAESQILRSLLLSPKYQESSKLLEKAGLLTELQTMGTPLTFFLPQDAYVLTHIDDRFINWLTLPENQAYLEKVMKFHITVGRYTYTNFTTPPITFPSLNGAPLHVRFGQKNLQIRLLVEWSPLKRTDSLTEADGAVHGIDGFLIPPDVAPAVLCPVLEQCGPAAAPMVMTIIDALLANGNSELVEYLKATQIVEAVGMLTGVTIYAPSNEAFKIFLGSLTASEKQMLPSVLQWILWYHVGQGYYDATALTLGKTQATYLKGKSVSTAFKGSKIYVNPESTNAKIVKADILADGSASVQGIDKVLVPPGIFTMAPQMAPALAPTGPAPAPIQGAGMRLMESSSCMLLLLAVATFATLF